MAKEDLFSMRSAFEHLMGNHEVLPLGKVNTFFNETEKVHYYLASEYDMKNDPIGVHEFYDKHVSRSLPAVLRNGCSDWSLKQKYDQSEGTSLQR